MATVLDDVSPEGMARAIALDFVATLRVLASTPYGKVHDAPDVPWIMSGIPIPFFNGVYWTQMAPELGPEEIGAKIRETLAPFKERRVPMQWAVMPQTHPADLGRYLEAEGLALEDSSPGMAVDLHTLREPPVPDGLSIERVVDDESARVWNEISLRGFGASQEIIAVFERVVLHLYPDMETSALYLGRLDGEPVATSLLCVSVGVAGIYNVATLPHARRRGIGAAITVQALLDGRERGCRIGTLQASKMGYPVYEALGFREYFEIQHYHWSPEAS
jgi:ribosomal protein S18 acetylase RimI-like enzyme